MRNIGTNIRALRERQGLTQEELAQALFVTRQTVSNYETGKSRPDVDMLVKIAQVLETDVEQLLYGLSAEQDRRRAARRLGAGYLILLAIHLFSVLSAPMMNELIDHFAGILPVTLSALLAPAWWLVLGWCMLELLGLARLAHPFRAGLRVKQIRRGLLILLGVEMVLLLPLLGAGVVQAIGYAANRRDILTFPHIPVYVTLTNHLLSLNALHPQVYLVPGAALWLFRFPDLLRGASADLPPRP